MRDVGRQFPLQEPFDAALGRWSASRHGVFARDDAVRFGATHRMIRWRILSGRWEEMYPGVYRNVGAPHTWRQRMLAACVSCGALAVASHRAAAELRMLAGVERGAIETSVPRGKRQHRKGIVIHEVSSLPRVDVTIVDAIPVTTVTRTLIDLGAVVPADQLEEALDDALRRSLTTISRLRWRLAELARSGRSGVGPIRNLLDARESGAATPQSILETRFRRLLRRAGLPPPIPQYEVRAAGRLLAIVDFAYPDIKLAIEVDGYRWHSGRARWEHDLARRNRLTVRGWRIVHFTSADLTRNSEHLIETVASTLAEPHPR
jgi:hypothetical protein